MNARPTVATSALEDITLPSDRRVTWLIARRGALESLRDRTTLAMSIVFAVVAPLMVVLTFVRPRMLVGAADVGATVAIYLLGVGLGPAGGSIGVASGLFAGEKEQGNLLPLLATPASNRAIFAGKVLAAVLPTFIYAFVAVLTYGVEIWLLLGVGVLRLIPVPLILGTMALIPINIVLGAALASVVSSRVRTYQSAQMVSSLLLYPLMGIQFGLLLGPGGSVRLTFVAISLLTVIVLDILLVVVGAATWKREEVLARR